MTSVRLCSRCGHIGQSHRRPLWLWRLLRWGACAHRYRLVFGEVTCACDGWRPI